MKQILFYFAFIIIAINGYTQEDITWLNEYTSDLTSGSYTYAYSFYNLEKDCKIKIEEKKTSKKGSETIKSNI